MTNSNPRHPDIEIYIKQSSTQQVQQWLSERFEQLQTLQQRAKTWQLEAKHKGQTIPITLIEKAIGNYTSIWFDSDQTPWPQDLDCAIEAQQYFQREVRCIASGWNEGDEPDEWWSLTDEGQHKILWKS